MKWRIAGCLALSFAGQAMAWQNPPPDPHMNVPASQIHSSADAQLQASVRKAIANDATLSDAGHHATVIVSEGAVVLRGQVEDDTEKSRIDTLVRQVNGVKEVTNELDVKPKPAPG